MGFFTRTSKQDAPGQRVAAAEVSAATIAAVSTTGVGRDRAMSIPTVARSRDLLATIVGSLPIRHLATVTQPTGDVEEVPLPLEGWMIQPDPARTRSWMLAWTFDSLYFYGYAAWYVTSRYSDGRPATFTLLPPENVYVNATTFIGNAPFGAYTIEVAGNVIPDRDLVMFWSPTEPLLRTGYRAMLLSERLDLSALRFAANPVAMGYLRQVGGEPLSSDELSELAQAWASARAEGAIGALNEFTEWHESGLDLTKFQSLESRQHQALELARVCGISPYLVGAPTGTGMTYQNAQQAQEQLLIDARPYIECIEQTLSASPILPRGRIVRLGRHDDGRVETAARVSQQVYLAVDSGVLTRDEARRMIREAGADLEEDNA